MFSWLTGKNKKHTLPDPAPTESVSPGNTFLRNAEGFWLPQSAQTLLSAPKRQRWLQQISPVVALPEREYRVLCLEPVHRLAEALQCVPAGRNGHYQGEGGLLDLTLNTTAWCIRMSQKEMLPRGVPAEEKISKRVQLTPSVSVPLTAANRRKVKPRLTAVSHRAVP